MRANSPQGRLRCLLAVAALLSAVPAARGDDDPSFRAFWADAFSSGFKSISQIDSMVSRAVTGNYNAIIAEVLAYHDTGGSGHGAYWDSNIVPRASDIVGSIDPLLYLVSAAHANDIEVQAWIVPYRACRSWPPNGNTTLSAHPRWFMVEQADMGDGPELIGEGYSAAYMLDPGSPDVQEYLVSIVRELVTNYAVDGINLDYIRYTQTDAGYPADTSYAKSTLARFQALTGYVGTPPPEGCPSWNDFRRRTIDESVRRLRAEIPTITSNPRQPVRFSADLICWGDAPGNFIYSDAYRLHQNWRHWMEQGWLDTGIPMNYKREYDAGEAQQYRNWVDAAVNDWRYARQIACGQGNYLNRKADSVTQLQYGLTAGADGTCNYSYYETADENMNGYPETDWSWYTYVSTHVFTSPVATPAMPWRDPNTAVEGTLWGQVVNETTGEVVDGATVQVGTLTPVETDGNGYYVVTLIAAASGGTTYDVTVDAAGCPEQTIEDVVVLPGGVVRQDVIVCIVWGGPGDMNEDGHVNFDDLPLFLFCLRGPELTYTNGNPCLLGDADADDDVDLTDLAHFQQVFEGD